MTIWVDRGVIQYQLIEPLGSGEITDVELGDEISRVEVTITDTINLDTRTLHDLESFIGSIGSVDPNLTITSENDKTILTLEADSVVFDWKDNA
jgi:hypothetical protein